VAAMLIFCGCEASTPEIPGDVLTDGSIASSTLDPESVYTGSSSSPIDLSKVVWLHPDVSSWPETRKLNAVTFGDGLINYHFDAPDPWRNVNGVNGNVWVFINLNGTWHAVTHEYMRQGYTTRGMNTVEPGHFKSGTLANYRPSSGTEYGWMVSGLIRGGDRNVQERSNIVMANWP